MTPKTLTNSLRQTAAFAPLVHTHFGRHTDRLTGVRPWFKPFDVEYDFTYVGIDKQGRC